MRAHGGVVPGALFLLLVPGFLAEVASQNTQFLTYLEPKTLFFGSLAYGVPVLLIRELAVARQLNALGIALLGLAYGILNEGVLAKTLTQASGAPLYDFAGYGQAGTLQWGWTIFMVTWHVLHSVLCPILLASWLFPASASRRWFMTRGGRVALYLCLVLLLALYGQYFATAPPGGAPVFAGYIVATLALVAVAWRYCVARGEPASADATRSSRKPALLGCLAVLFYFATFWMPGHVPFAVFLVVTTVSIAAAIWLMWRAGWRPLPDLLLFALGDYLGFAVLAAALAMRGQGDAAQAGGAGVFFVVLFGWLILAVSKQPSGRGAAVVPAPA